MLPVSWFSRGEEKVGSKAVRAAKEISGPQLHFVLNESWCRCGLWETSQSPWWRLNGMSRPAHLLPLCKAVLRSLFMPLADSTLLLPSEENRN